MPILIEAPEPPPPYVIAAFERIDRARAWDTEMRLTEALALECYCPRSRHPLSIVPCAQACRACWQGAREARGLLHRGSTDQA